MCNNGSNNNSSGPSGGPWHSSGLPKGDPNKNPFNYDDTMRRKARNEYKRNSARRALDRKKAEAEAEARAQAEAEARAQAEARARFSMNISDIIDQANKKKK